ncbi:hypothetical protein RRG08_054125 [Elysia crispata]|uniref:Uncharacterized protein n=1 Tax=Elysia crispata TaxID=231223 RepID=A0AAE0Y7T0_9GAST|nr:hypothetical protein RRG08_054125 [Elysia crispata]
MIISKFSKFRVCIGYPRADISKCSFINLVTLFSGSQTCSVFKPYSYNAPNLYSVPGHFLYLEYKKPSVNDTNNCLSTRDFAVNQLPLRPLMAVTSVTTHGSCLRDHSRQLPLRPLMPVASETTNGSYLCDRSWQLPL